MTISKLSKCLGQNVSPELRTLALLSRPHLTQRQKQLILNQSPLNYERFVNMLFKHRVHPCVFCNIRDHLPEFLSPDHYSLLELHYKESVRKACIHFKELSKLLKAFHAEEICARPVKGIPLASSLYGDIAKRACGDIDILIPHNKFDDAHELLLQIGYKNNNFSNLPYYLQTLYFSRYKDVCYFGPQGVILELHTRLQEHSSSLGRYMTEKHIEGQLSQEEEFIYLCWHSASTSHHRLKWLTDIALYLEKSSLDWCLIKRLACRLDGVRCITTNLMLVDHLFETDLSADAMEKFPPGEVDVELAKISLENLESPVESKSLGVQAKIVLREFYLVARIKNKLQVLVQMFKPSLSDMQSLPLLPQSLKLLYYFLRPVLVLIRYVESRKALSAK